jgi:hypothetical protein
MTIRSLKRTLTGEVRAELLALTALGAALVIGAIPAQAAQVLDVRVGRHVDFTRVVFELDAATGYRIERHEPAPGVSELVVSLEATSKPLELKASNSLIEGVALEPRGSENSIARIRLKESGLHLKQMTLVNPPRIVVDVLRPKSKAPAPAASKTPRRTAKTPDKPAPGAPAKLGAAARETEKTAAPAQSQGAEPSAIPRESQPEQTSRPAAPPVPSPARDQRPARVVAPAAESAPAAKPDQPGEPSEGAMVEGGDEPQQLAMVKQPAAQGEGAAPRPARVTPREPARPPPARTQSPRPSGGPMAAARASRSDSGDSLFSPMNLGLAAAGVLFLVAVPSSCFAGAGAIPSRRRSTRRIPSQSWPRTSLPPPAPRHRPELRAARRRPPAIPSPLPMSPICSTIRRPKEPTWTRYQDSTLLPRPLLLPPRPASGGARM